VLGQPLLADQGRGRVDEDRHAEVATGLEEREQLLDGERRS
jgi:hypothetical protein